MKRAHVGVAAGAVLAGLLVVPATGIAGTTEAGCTSTLLPDPPGGTVYEVTGTDDQGTYVGRARSADGTRFGVVWRDGGVERLDTLLPADINRDGLMAGHVEEPDIVPPATRDRAAIQPLDGEVERLPPAAAPSRAGALQYKSAAVGMNNRGDVVGTVSTQFPTGVVASAWTAQDQAWVELSWGRFSLAGDIDDSGLVISPASFSEPAYGGMIWRLDGSEVRVYGPYGDTDTRIDLFAIDDGLLAATRTAPGAGQEIVLIDAETDAVTPVPGSAGATPTDIAGGVIVGKGPDGPMLWRAGEAVALPATGGTRDVTVVNADGTEAAGVTGDDGDTHATLWRC